jgi:hypothetical protein
MDDPLPVLVPLDATQIGNRQNLNRNKTLRVKVNPRHGGLLVLGDAYEGGGGADRDTAKFRG